MLSGTTAAAFQRPNILRRCLARTYPTRRLTLREQARTLLVLFACLFSFTAFAVDLERKVDFDIPAQSLSAALIQFSHQAKIQVLRHRAHSAASQHVKWRRPNIWTIRCCLMRPTPSPRAPS